MRKERRKLADTINDPVIKKKPDNKKKKQKNSMLSKYILTLVIGFAGGFSFAKLFRL